MGTYIQFDTLGRVGAPVARYSYIYDTDLNRVYQSAGDVLVAEAIPQLIEAGYEDRILLSQDVCMKIHLKAYGGTGYSFVMEKFLPYLLTLGVTEEQATKMMFDNPMRVLTLVEPG